MNIYLAGPLFTLAEHMFNAELAAALRKCGHEVWLPQDYDQGSARERSTFNRDTRAIDRSDIVVANMDGPDPDSGTCWECGYAYACGIPVVIFRTDWRSAGKAGPSSYNLMMTQSADGRLRPPFADIADLAQQIHAALDPARDNCTRRVSRAASEPNSGNRRTNRLRR
jgi:nucleoside 2-deoxyribosyltransferase